MNKKTSIIIAAALFCFFSLSAGAGAQDETQANAGGQSAKAVESQASIEKAPVDSGASNFGKAPSKSSSDAPSAGQPGSVNASSGGQSGDAQPASGETRQRKIFDYSSAIDLDAIGGGSGHVRNHTGPITSELKPEDIKDDPDKRNAEVISAGFGGALKGLMWSGGVASVIVLIYVLIKMRNRGGAQALKGNRTASSGKNDSLILVLSVVLVLMVGVSVGSVPLIMSTMDAQRNAFMQATKEKPPLAFFSVYSYEYGLHGLMPKPFKKLRVDFPPQPLSIANNQGSLDWTGPKPLDVVLDYNVISYEDPGGRGVALGYSRLPAMPQSTVNGFSYFFDTDKGLDSAVKACASMLNGKITLTVPISLANKQPGREVEGALDEGLKDSGTFRQRIYITKAGNYYQLTVWGDPKFVNSKEAYTFLDSLELPGQDGGASQSASGSNSLSSSAGNETSNLAPARSDNTVAKSGTSSPDEQAKEFFRAAAARIQSHLDLDPNTPQELTMLIGLSRDGKITKLDVQTGDFEGVSESTVNAVSEAVNISAPFPNVPKMAGDQFLFKLKLTDGKVQLMPRYK